MGQSIREIVLGWDPFTEPTQHQYDMTHLWMRIARGNLALGASDTAKVKELIRRYEHNHPELFPRKDCECPGP
jgi:hypothetical protein